MAHEVPALALSIRNLCLNIKPNITKLREFLLATNFYDIFLFTQLDVAKYFDSQFFRSFSFTFLPFNGHMFGFGEI